MGKISLQSLKNILESRPEIWDLFTKKEEYEPWLVDKYQRFPYYASQQKNIWIPEVSQFLKQKGLQITYPEGKKFAVCLTHDIDFLHLPKNIMLSKTFQKLKRRELVEALKILFGNFIENLNPVWNCEQIMNLEAKYRARSTFFFLSLNRHDLDFSYKIKKLGKRMRNVIKNGWEVALQGGHEAYCNLTKIIEEKKRLENIIEAEVVGYRNHYLRFKVPTTWILLDKAGFKYDSTFGYANCVGFKNGLAHPFNPFNLRSRKYIDILEIPLHISDFALTEYMRLDLKTAWSVTRKLLNQAEKVNGILTILWHNHNFEGEMLDFYEHILSYCWQRKAWMASAQEIWKYWKANIS